MADTNVFYLQVDGARVKPILVKNLISSLGIAEESVIEAHIIADDCGIDPGESKLILDDSSEIPITDNRAVLRAAIEAAPTGTKHCLPIAWTAPHVADGIESTQVCLLCMKHPYTQEDTLEEAATKLCDLAKSVCMKGDEVFVADTYQFSDGLFHDEDSQPRLLLRSIIRKQGFSELERIIFHELKVTTRWAFNIAAKTVNFLTDNPIATTDPRLLKLCNRLRQESEPLNTCWDNALDRIIAAAKGSDQDKKRPNQ